MRVFDPSIFNSISQNLDIGIIVTDKENTILFCNNWVLNRIKISKNDIFDKKIIAVFPELNNTRMTKVINDAIQYGLPAIVSNVFNRSPFPLFAELKNEKRIFQSINVIPFEYESNSYVITQITDVSASVKREKALEKQALKRKEAEKDLRAALDKLNEASAIKSDFLAAMSHEIRTPMNGIVGISNLLKKTELTNNQTKHLETIDDSVNLLLTVINDILDFSKLESGKFTFNNTSFKFESIVTSILDLLSISISSNNISTIIDIDKESNNMFIGDDNRIKQVLLNLISNAIKFTNHGEVTIEIRCLEATEYAHTLKVSVKDTGIGIDSDTQKTLFEKFTQADSSTTRKYGGTGLGLAISKNIIELMHGSIGVESILDEGSTFWFIIELPKADINSPIESKVNINLSALSFTGDVLLVDDVAVNRIVATAMLEEMGFDVIAAENGQEAFEKVKKQKFSFILMDCQMPVMDGFEASEEIRKLEDNKSHIPIIALTALAMKGDNQKCFDAGMDDYITKPYSAQDLVAAISRCVDFKTIHC